MYRNISDLKIEVIRGVFVIRGGQSKAVFFIICQINNKFGCSDYAEYIKIDNVFLFIKFARGFIRAFDRHNHKKELELKE